MCPIGHATPVLVMLDKQLFNFPLLWAAAGHPHAVFSLTPVQLQGMTGAAGADLCIDG